MGSLLFVAVGACAGVAAGIFGIGGGIILIPALVFLLKYPQHTANGMSLVALLLPVGLLGAYEYYRSGRITMVEIQGGLWIGAGLFVGTFAGAKIAALLTPSMLQRLFALLLAIVAVRFFLMSFKS